MENATPMLRQYLEIKQLYPGTLLFFRLGDFYELFNEDAITGSRELQITLTARQKAGNRRVSRLRIAAGVREATARTTAHTRDRDTRTNTARAMLIGEA